MVSRFLKALPVFILGAIMFAVGTSPHSIVSNISRWAYLLHINLPHALKGKTIDTCIFWICFIGIVLYLIWLFRRKKKRGSRKKAGIAAQQLEQSDFLTRLKSSNIRTTENDYYDISPIEDLASQTIDGETLIGKWGILSSDLLHIVRARRIIALTPDKDTYKIANETEEEFEKSIAFHAKENEIEEDTVLRFRFRARDIRAFERQNEILKHKPIIIGMKDRRKENKKN
jgi:Ca2+/Na+ antiporter